MTSDFLSERAVYSKQRIAQLRLEVGDTVRGVELDNLTIFTVGSFARHEASEHSDVDLFFTFHPTGKDLPARRTNELKLFGRLIDLVEKLGFPAFSNDAQYLRTHDVEDVLNHLGGPSMTQITTSRRACCFCWKASASSATKNMKRR